MQRLLKFFLPHGIVELLRNGRKVRDIGRQMRLGDWLRSRQLANECNWSGLSLFPPGYAAKLRRVVDVGANTGQWSSMLLDCISPEQLIVIEPEPVAFSQLRQKFGENPRVQLHNVAVGASEGTAKFNVTRDTTGASLLKPREEMRQIIGSNWTIVSEIAVLVTTLDRLLLDAGELSLLKIDVQGYEEQVLMGATQTLARTNFVLIELNYMPQYESGSCFGDVHRILTDEFGFFLANASAALVLNGRASMCDGLYVNPKLVSEWVKPDFV